MRLGVNLDHVATVRQARRAAEPDPAAAAVLAELGGADGITVHLREDRRHIQDRDLRLLRDIVRGRLNLEMAATPEMIDIALNVKPDQATLVPERREEITTEGGIDLAADPASIKRAVSALRHGGIFVALFIDPEPESVKTARKVEADAVEIHTGMYANARSETSISRERERVTHAARLAARLGLHVHAGHGLTYANVGAVAAIPEMEELNIGHAIVSRALFTGMAQAVREMKERIASARIQPGA